MFESYFDVSKPADGSFAPLKLAFTILHGVMAGNPEKQIALSFPDYYFDNGKNGVGTLGDTIRVFAESSLLIELRNHPYLKNIEGPDILTLSGIEKVPDDALATCFVRDRTVEHYHNAAKKYEDFKTRAGGLRVPPHITLESSGSTAEGNQKNNFTMFIRRVAAPAHKTGRYTSYGLSIDGSTVPWFYK